MITVGLKEETIIKIIEECIKPLSGLKNGFEKQENRADEIAENLPPEKYPSVSAVIAFVKNKIEVFSEAVGKVYLKATDFEDYKTDASNTYAKKTDVENFENNVADTYATKTDVENFENNVAKTYATKTDVEDFENNVADTYATKTDVENFENNIAETYATKTDVEDLKTDTEVTATATGKAITINPANAPLQSLKLYGKTTQDGTPTPTSPIELKSVGDSGSFEVSLIGGNYFDKSKVSSYVTETKTGFSFINDNVNFAPVNVGRLNHLAPCLKVGDIVTFYVDTVNSTKPEGFVYLAGSGFDWDSGVFHTITENDLNGFLYVYGLVNEVCEYNNFRITKIENAPYEPYTEQTFTNNDTLRGVNCIADEKDFARAMKTQRFGIVDLGTLDWTVFNSPNNEFVAYNIANFKHGMNGLCSKYPLANSLGEDKALYMRDTWYGGTTIGIRDTSYTDAETLKASLSGTMFVYELETPIETPLTEQELNAYRQLMTNSGNTTILSEADMEVDYYINKPNAQAIGNIHSQINKDYFKLQQAIISTGGN